MSSCTSVSTKQLGSGWANAIAFSNLEEQSRPMEPKVGLVAVLLLAALMSGCGGGGAGPGARGTPPSTPAVPRGLTATAGNQQVALTWVASTGATSYNVKRSTTSGGGYTRIASASTTSYADTGVANGTPYFYVVSALNSVGESGNSSQAGATPITADVTITVDPIKTKPISPWIYGINFYTGISGAPSHLTIDRACGNRWTAYNWETNDSKAGS